MSCQSGDGNIFNLIYWNSYNNGFILPYLGATNGTDHATAAWSCPVMINNPLYSNFASYGYGLNAGGLTSVKLGQITSPSDSVCFADSGILNAGINRHVGQQRSVLHFLYWHAFLQWGLSTLAAAGRTGNRGLV